MKKATRAIPNQRLVNERLLRHWSQQELAAQVGTTAINVSRWERGITTPGPYFQQQLCNLFAKKPGELGLTQQQSDIGTQISIPALHDPAIPPHLTGRHPLIGRDALLARLKQQLCGSKKATPVALHGLPGVGKTSLAITLAHDRTIRDHFCGGVLWAGLGPGANIFTHLYRWGELVGIDAIELENLTSLAEWAIALRSMIGTRRMLLIIDDAWQIDDALAFQVGGPACTYILTTRYPEIARQFAGEAAIAVQELSEDDGMLLLKHFAPQVVEDQAEEVRALVQAVGGLPLAITLIGGYLHLQAQNVQPRRLQSALARLKSAEERLRLAQPLAPLERSPNLPSGIPLSLQAAIAISDQQLDEQARSALRALSTFSAKPATFSEESALALTGYSPDVLDRLSDAGLLESSDPGHYMLHQVIVDYARLHRKDMEPQAEQV